jgi:protein required for attachment to host cells
MKSWVLVANGTRARIFEVRNRRSKLREIFDLVNPEERLHRRDFKSDKPGRTFDSFGGGRHAVQTVVDPKEQAAIRFAHEVVDHLNTEYVLHHFDGLCIVASPRFLGLLRERIKGALSSALIGEVNKDLTRESPESIEAHVSALLSYADPSQSGVGQAIDRQSR